jgi:hypothetical protein
MTPFTLNTKCLNVLDFIKAMIYLFTCNRTEPLNNRVSGDKSSLLQNTVHLYWKISFQNVPENKWITVNLVQLYDIKHRYKKSKLTITISIFLSTS